MKLSVFFSQPTIRDTRQRSPNNGSNPEKPKLFHGKTAREKGLTNTIFLDFQPRERLPELQAASNVSVVSLLPGQGKNFFPSKIIAYMAAGRAVLGSVDAQSDTARFIENWTSGALSD